MNVIFPVAVIDELFVDTSQFFFYGSLKVQDCFYTSLCNQFDVVGIERVWPNHDIGSRKLREEEPTQEGTINNVEESVYEILRVFALLLVQAFLTIQTSI